MKIRLYLCLMMLMVLCFNGKAAQADYLSTFDSSGESWRITAGCDSFGFDDSRGNPPGSISYVDQTGGGDKYFVSPLGWGGDWSAYKNGTLQYDIKFLSGSGVFKVLADVVIRSSGDYLSQQFITTQPSDWTHYTVSLTAAAFGVSEKYFDSIMAQVDSVDIRGEFLVGPESGALDNVRLTAVPIPGSLFLLACGLPAIIALRSKFGR